jgi:hypothetical protein
MRNGRRKHYQFKGFHAPGRSLARHLRAAVHQKASNLHNYVKG